MNRKLSLSLIILFAAIIGLSLPAHAADSKPNAITSSNADKLKVLATITDHAENDLAMAFSPDGKWLASGNLDSLTRLWNVQDVSKIQAGPVLKGHTGQVAIVAFSADGKSLITGSYDQTLRFWDAQSGKQTDIQQNPGPDIEQLGNVLSPDQSLLVYGNGSSVYVWDVKNKKQAENSVFNNGGAFTAGAQGPFAFASDAKSLYVANANGNTVFQIPVVGDAKDMKPLFTGTKNAQYIGPLVLTDDGTIMAIGALDAETSSSFVDVFDVKAGKLLLTIPGGDKDLLSINLAFNRDGSLLVSSGNDGNALWDVKTGKQIGTLSTGQILTMAFNPDGTLLAVARPRTSDKNSALIELWGLSQ